MFEHVAADTLTCGVFARVAAGTVLGILIAGLPGGSRSPASTPRGNVKVGLVRTGSIPLPY